MKAEIFKKIAKAIIVSVMSVMLFSSSVFAYNNYQHSRTWSGKEEQSTSGYYSSVYYDYGSNLPNDDACFESESTGAGSNYAYVDAYYYGGTGHYYNSFTKTGGAQAYIIHVSTGYDYMTGVGRAKNSNIAGVQLTIVA